jgi:putative transposase
VTKLAFVAAEQSHHCHHAVARLWRIVGVSGVYTCLYAIPAVQDRAEAEADLRRHVERIFATRRRVYGPPRIHAELRREGRRQVDIRPFPDTQERADLRPNTPTRVVT